MILVNPTGLGLREDSAGSGRFGAKRGSRKHQGYDFLCKPKQIIKAPIAGKLVKAYPYQGDIFYIGCRISGENWKVKMFYFVPYDNLINENVLAGDEIGIAQDISVKYGGRMKPHIHLALYKMNPMVLVNPEDYLEADKEQLKKGGY